MKRFFEQVADLIEDANPATAEKLRRASPHWMRHTHALERGVDLTTARDNLRHALIATKSIYLHAATPTWVPAVEQLKCQSVPRYCDQCDVCGGPFHAQPQACVLDILVPLCRT